MDALLTIDHVSVEFRQGQARIEALRAVSLEVRPAECIGIVGESGSGKTQLFMAAMGLLPRNARAQGSIRFDGQDLLRLERTALNHIRGAHLAMIFQDAMSALTPHVKVGVQLAEVLVAHRNASWSQAWEAAADMLERVRVSQSALRLHQYPHELSGGMRQRVMIGAALMCRPSLLIADEPTTALDVTVQGHIIQLLADMRAAYGMSLVLISHDFGVMAGLADRVFVMYAGRVVETGPTSAIFAAARHPYAAALVQCVPRAGQRLARLPTIAGQPPRAGENLAGCAFAPRCPRAAERCRRERPELAGDAVHRAACHFPLSA